MTACIKVRVDLYSYLARVCLEALPRVEELPYLGEMTCSTGRTGRTPLLRRQHRESTGITLAISFVAEPIHLQESIIYAKPWQLSGGTRHYACGPAFFTSRHSFAINHGVDWSKADLIGIAWMFR